MFLATRPGVARSPPKPGNDAAWLGRRDGAAGSWFRRTVEPDLPSSPKRSLGQASAARAALSVHVPALSRLGCDQQCGGASASTGRGRPQGVGRQSHLERGSDAADPEERVAYLLAARQGRLRPAGGDAPVPRAEDSGSSSRLAPAAAGESASLPSSTTSQAACQTQRPIGAPSTPEPVSGHPRLTDRPAVGGVILLSQPIMQASQHVEVFSPQPRMMGTVFHSKDKTSKKLVSCCLHCSLLRPHRIPFALLPLWWHGKQIHRHCTDRSHREPPAIVTSHRTSFRNHIPIATDGCGILPP